MVSIAFLSSLLFAQDSVQELQQNEQANFQKLIEQNNKDIESLNIKIDSLQNTMENALPLSNALNHISEGINRIVSKQNKSWWTEPAITNWSSIIVLVVTLIVIGIYTYWTKFIAKETRRASEINDKLLRLQSNEFKLRNIPIITCAYKAPEGGVRDAFFLINSSDVTAMDIQIQNKGLVDKESGKLYSFEKTPALGAHKELLVQSFIENNRSSCNIRYEPPSEIIISYKNLSGEKFVVGMMVGGKECKFLSLSKAEG